MSKWTVGILGLVIFIVCGDQFQADKNIVLILMIAFVLILLSTEKKKGSVSKNRSHCYVRQHIHAQKIKRRCS